MPLLAGAADRGSRERAGWIGSALLTWVLVVLVPVGVLLAVFAGPIVGLFFGGAIDGCDVGDVSAVATRMLVVFAPQIPLYGVAVVLYGVLQSHKRFTGPAVAPLVSSIVVIVAYLLFVPLSGGESDPGAVPEPAELALSVGTSLGVLSLVLAVLGPVARLGLRWRPTLRFPGGVAGQVRRLALAGIAALLAQQAAMIVVLVLSNHAIGNGAIAVYNYAWAIYLVPYAVLAVPIATSAFPGCPPRRASRRRSRRWRRARPGPWCWCQGWPPACWPPRRGPVRWCSWRTRARCRRGAGGGDRAVHARADRLRADRASQPGAVRGRPRARGRRRDRGRLGVVMVAQTVFVLVLPDRWEIGGMALGMSVGMTVGGGMLLWSVVRARGRGRGRARQGRGGGGRRRAAGVSGGGRGGGVARCERYLGERGGRGGGRRRGAGRGRGRRGRGGPGRRGGGGPAAAAERPRRRCLTGRGGDRACGWLSCWAPRRAGPGGMC
ncbi:lipid II flippase MurJ [Nonomuraea rubra]|uniref:lipid II flippase MurJ n=1 Tax=Nonomuraea rubra TaxID=46180 RepID=UPI00360D5616